MFFIISLNNIKRSFVDFLRMIICDSVEHTLPDATRGW